MLALSGIYTGAYGFGGYSDELVYLNSLVDCMANMPIGHPYIDLRLLASARIKGTISSVM